MAPLQKRALWGLIVGLVFTIAFVLVFTLMGGIETFDQNQNFRLIIDALWISILLINLFTINTPLRKPYVVDERDRLIADRAPRIQWMAVVFTLVGWTIALTEIYHETGLVPYLFLYIIFMSVLIVSTLAQSLGILFGYWRMGRNA